MAVAALMSTVASAGASQVYVLDNWPADIDNIPCSAWKKSADGTWVLDGRVKVGSSEIENVVVKGDAAAHMLEKRCGR
jgi:hypothetical protein